jgi:hypothetical protein
MKIAFQWFLTTGCRRREKGGQWWCKKKNITLLSIKFYLIAIVNIN